MNTWLSVDEVMTLLAITRTNTYQLARRYHWHRSTHHGRVYYLFTDVLDTPRTKGP